MSTATNGRAREYRVRDHMIRNGWACVMRASGSRGAADLAMLHPFVGLAWVQVGTRNKTLGCRDKGHSHEDNTAAWCARDRLVSVAEQTGALALLAVCSPGIPPRFWRVTRDTPSKWTEFQP